MASQLGNLSVVATSTQLSNTASSYDITSGCNITSGYNTAKNNNSAPFYKPA